LIQRTLAPLKNRASVVRISSVSIAGLSVVRGQLSIARIIE
jgi:hypothetical protein